MDDNFTCPHCNWTIWKNIKKIPSDADFTIEGNESIAATPPAQTSQKREEDQPIGVIPIKTWNILTQLENELPSPPPTVTLEEIIKALPDNKELEARDTIHNRPKWLFNKAWNECRDACIAALKDKFQ